MLARLIIAFAFALLTAAPSLAVAEDKKPAEKPPKIIVVSPLGIVPGVSTRLILRGLHLDESSGVEVTAGNEPVEAKIVDKKKTPLPPNQTADLAGDTQVEIELTLPADKKPDALSLIVVGPKGKTEPYQLPVTPAEVFVAEEEPNDAFAQCQPIVAGKLVVGNIHEAKNVDVFSFDGHAGDTVTFVVAARQHGSRLDALLWLHDARGHLLASADDDAESVDARLQLALPSDGKYFLTLMDANDLGSSVHVYRMSFTSNAAAK